MTDCDAFVVVPDLDFGHLGVGFFRLQTQTDFYRNCFPEFTAPHVPLLVRL